MVNIKNIKVTETDLKKFDSKALKKCLELANKANIKENELKAYLPHNPKITVSFDINETNSSFANAIRRCLMNEIEVKSFTFDSNKDLDTSDVFILSDFIEKQIDLLPINQEFNYNDVKIFLEKENKTDEIIDVLSDDITVLHNKENISSKILGKNIVLCRLRPAEYIKIKNIQICTGIGNNDSAKFNLLSNITYKIKNVNPILETKYGTTGVSSMVTNPTEFFISYTTHRNISKPLLVMVKCCDTLINRLTNILVDFKQISNKDHTNFTELIDLESKGDLKKIQIKGEYWTIINLICKFCYILTKGNIKFISPSLIHPEREIGIIKIIHPEFSTLIQNAIKKIISELEIVKAAFS
jgi:DNA-directed RNA polymerase subunit L